MPKFKKGHPKLGGRKRGSRNKVPVELREMIREALRLEGGVKYLRWAMKTQPAAFLALVGRLIPAEIKADLGGAVVEVTLRNYTGIEHEVPRVPLLKAPEVTH